VQEPGSSGSRIYQVWVQVMKRISWFFIGFTCFLLLLSGFSPVSGASTQLHMVKYAADGSTVLNETTIDYRWMEQNLPVKGDGTTHYYLQGPVFVDKPEDRWNPAEDTNVKEKDMGAIKGTDARDLCNLVGGMVPGDELVVKATDGFSRSFAYENIYEPSSRQGPVIIAWYNGQYGYVPAYPDGMRLLFLADTSGNPFGIHAMGAWDWHESADEKYWYYYYNGNEKYPTTTGLSVQSVGEILIYSQEEPSGTIHVTSEPSGSAIFVDDEDTGRFTPADITGVSPGTHLISVQSPGYELPEPLMVDVTLNTVTPASFVLVKASGTSTTVAEGGAEVLTSIENTGPGVTGSVLDLYAHENIRGNISIIPVSGLSGSIKGGEERKLSLPFITPPENITLARLYVFSSGGYDMTRAVSAEPSFLVEQGTASIKPDRVYRDPGRNVSSGIVTTSCFNLLNFPNRGQIISKLTMDNSPGTSCILEGAVLVVVSRNNDAPAIAYWLHEGADVISAQPGQESSTAETTTEFNIEWLEPVISHANLQFVSTSMEQDAQSHYQAEINGETFEGTFKDPRSPVRTAMITVPAPSPGSHVETSLRAIFNESSALYGETRIEIFTAYVEEDRTGPANITLNTTISRKTGNSSIYPTIASLPAGNHPAENFPGPAQVKTPPAKVSKDFSSWSFDILDRIFSFLFSIAGDTTPLDRNYIQSESIDAAVSDNVTETAPKSDKTQGISLESDFYPVEEKSVLVPSFPITGSNNDTPAIALINYTMVVNDTGKTISRKPASHSGGIYITSYPADAELRVDTKKIDVVLPAVVYGLKEGIHNVEVRQTSDKDKTVISRSLRVWVYADAITTANFNLISGNIPRKIRINSTDNTPYSFTINGYYPIRKTPTEIEFTTPDDFLTVIRDGAYISYRPFTILSDENTVVVPPLNPSLYKLSVESSPPGGEIFVDGLWSGFTTPAVIPNLSAGLHRIIVSLPGHIPGEVIMEIPLTDDPVVQKPVSIILDTYASGPVTLESIPPAADIFVDGYATGEITPHTFGYLPLGIHQITVRRNGETRTVEINVKPGNTNREVVMFQGKGMAT